MGDLQVDYATLSSCAETAKEIKAAFDGLPDRTGDTSGCWGHSGIAHAMHAFGTNWGYHREILSQQIQETAEKQEKCLQVFEEADKTLAAEMRKSMAHHR